MTVNIANISLGSGPGTQTGEPLRTAFGKINDNFSNLSTAISSISPEPTTGNLVFSDQTIVGTMDDTDVVLNPIGIGEVVIAGNLRTSFLNFRGNSITTQYAGDLVLNASAGNIRLMDPLKFADGSVQHSAALSDGDTVQTLTVNDLQSALSNIITLNGHTANYEIYNWANGNPILSNVASVAFTADYSDLINTPVIPTHTSNLTNDSGYITSAAVTWANVINRPTNNSDFANDSGFITSDALYWNNIQERPANVSAFTNDAGYITSSAIPSDVSAFNNDSGFITGAYVSWANVSGKPNFADIATSGSYSDLSGVPTTLSQFSNDTNFANVTYVDDRITAIINNAPAALDTLKEIADSLGNSTSLSASLTTLISTKANANAVVSSFTNDAGYITVADVTWANVGGKPTFANVATSGDYNDLSNTPSIPTVPSNVSSFTNDAGYITSSTANVISVNGQTGVVTLDLNTYTDSNVANFLSNYTGEINFIASPAIISGVGTITTVTANVTGNVNTTGNVTASYFIGDGSQLTGLPASYTNSNVADYLPTYTGNVTAGNVIATHYGNASGTTATYTGNVTANKFIGDGQNITNLTYNSTGNIVGTSSNVTLVAGSFSSIFDNTGNVTLPGKVIRSSWQAGEVIRTLMLGPGDLGIAADVTTSGGNVVTYSYAPLSSTSYIVVEFNGYWTVLGSQADSWWSNLYCAGTQIGVGHKFWSNAGDGTTDRAGHLLPIMGRYTNSDTATKAIYCQFNKDTSDDTVTLKYNNGIGFWLKITEIGR